MSFEWFYTFANDCILNEFQHAYSSVEFYDIDYFRFNTKATIIFLKIYFLDGE